ncbi:MAG TPA: MG2 domain-containing protein, partial [Polyangium sp.]|nr:MG2 domain-containing protein [Polyangium sp.]
PKADLGIRGNVFETVARREIPIDAINANDLELVVAPLTALDAIRLQDDQYSPGRNPSFNAIAGLPKAKITSLKPNAAKNATSRFSVNVDDVLGGKDARGAVAVGIRYTGWPGSDHARGMGSTAIAKVTDLAISGKLSRHGSLLWISRLSNAEPITGAEVSIERPGNPPVGPFRTDASGFVTIPENVFSTNLSATERGVVVVRHGNDWTYKHLEDRLDGWRFDARVDSSEERPFGLVFTDRGIYRPGDTVHIKGIFRKEGNPGTITPAGVPVEFKVESPEGEEISTQTETLSPFGTASVDIVVPKTGKLGTYAIRANVGGDQGGYAGDAREDFEVAEYRPVEFAVSVESDKPTYIRGDAAKWIARGDYLYGAPMATADARLTVTRSEAYFNPPNTDGFTVDDSVFHADHPDSSPRGGVVESREAKLDTKGNATIEAKLKLEGQIGPERLTAEADVTDLSRQSVAGSTTAIVHPGEFYLAMRTASDLFVDAGKSLEPEVFAVDPKGTRVGGVSVKLELIRRSWDVARKATAGGETHTVVQAVDKVVESCTVNTTTAAKPGSCKLTPAESGYHIVHATAVDSRKNPIGSSDPLYVFGSSGSAGFGDSDRLAIELVPDKKSYEVGQTARILVKSPFTSAEALVTIERAGILSQKRVQLKGPMPTIEVPITDAHRPNAFVSVMLVRGRTKPVPTKPKDPDVGAPAFRMGYTSLLINPEKRRLKIAISPSKTEAKPGENIDVDIKITDHAGKPARSEVTFYAVDEGVLSLIGYKTPDPIAVFGAERPLRVVSLEMRESLAHVFRPYGDLGVDKGLDGGDGGGGMSVRRDFRSSATFVPNIITDDSGRAHLSFRLPDTLTTYRLMAVTAAEDDRFGFAENRVVTSRPLMARPAMPRFFRAGDSIEAGVIVSSKGAGPMKATVQIKPQGLTLREGDSRTVDLAPGIPVEVRFPLSATQVGSAKIGFVVKASADGKNLEDAVEVSRDVRVPLSPEAVALYGDTTSASAEKLGDLSAIRNDVGGLEVSMASTALVGLGGGVEQLVDYPYGCTEQLVSKLVPLLPLRDLAKDFSLNLPKNTDAIILSTVAQVLKNQRSDGGFGMWNDSDESNLWATTYALWGLGEAQRHDVAVPQTALDDASRVVKRWLEKLDTEFGRATSPFILDVLAANGHPDPGRTTRVFEERKSLPLFSQAFLLHAMVLGKADAKSIETLVSELEGSLRLDANVARAATNLGDHYAVLMDSDTRTTALILRGILAAKPNHPLAAKLAMGLLADRKGGTWRNTQETAWSLVALADYKRAQEKTAPNFLAHVFLGQTEIATHPFKGATVDQLRTSIPAERLTSAGGSTLAFDVDGSGHLFYEARLRYAPKQLPTTALERGFFVQKTLRLVTPESLSASLSATSPASSTSFVGGNLVLTEIVVVTPSPRQYVVVDDPLPAGFEPVDARLATTSAGLDVDAHSNDNGEPEEAFDEP